MSILQEIKDALKILISAGTPKKNITVLHCNTNYPTSLKDVNLNAMITIKKELGVSIGYSDHTIDESVPVAATALGATVIEKHFTLNKNYSGPDHKASLSPKETIRMVDQIRKTEECLGKSIKFITKSEKKNRDIVRKSLVASKKIKKGEVFSEHNMTAKRPGFGKSPMEWLKIIGKKAKKKYKKNDFI